MALESPNKSISIVSSGFSIYEGPDACSIYGEEHCSTPIFPPVSVAQTTVLPIDAKSPDKHVPRDQRLIRLTGNHPFNAEAPLTDLFEAGKILEQKNCSS